MSLIIVLRNTSNLAQVSNYEYQVLIGDGTKERSKVLETGKVIGHHREDGWEFLLDKFRHSRIKDDRSSDL